MFFKVLKMFDHLQSSFGASVGNDRKLNQEPEEFWNQQQQQQQQQQQVKKVWRDKANNSRII